MGSDCRRTQPAPPDPYNTSKITACILSEMKQCQNLSFKEIRLPSWDRQLQLDKPRFSHPKL